MDPDLFQYLSSFVSDKRLARMDEVLEHRTRHVCMVLENVLQPHNASAVLRSADAFGVQDIHLITNDNKFKASKGVTRGSHKWLTLSRHNQRGTNNTAACFDLLRAQNYKIACLHPHAEARELSDLDLREQKIALVIGSERDGLSDYALENCDIAIKYPMYGYAESFNLSVLSALCMNEMRRLLKALPREVWALSETDKHDLKIEWIRKSVREATQVEERFQNNLIT